MKVYELTVLVHPDLEMNLEPALKKVEKLVSDNGGKIVKTTEDGKKRLAYNIKGNEYAVYYFYDVELPADAPQKISDALNITDEVLRYLLVVKDEKKKKYEERRAEAEKNGETEEVEAEGVDDKDNKEE